MLLGSVLATDLNVDWIEPGDLPQLQVRTHDILTDPVPAAAVCRSPPRSWRRIRR